MTDKLSIVDQAQELHTQSINLEGLLKGLDILMNDHDFMEETQGACMCVLAIALQLSSKQCIEAEKIHDVLRKA